eukprot:GDKK01010404.1.p1 GENE.GDKK01010404.1~~GDKK01010404.1.p1  ORF type:complete len:361 (+),score=82.93 GDKK01010404.1:1057-2139(+)
MYLNLLSSLSSLAVAPPYKAGLDAVSKEPYRNIQSFISQTPTTQSSCSLWWDLKVSVMLRSASEMAAQINLERLLTAVSTPPPPEYLNLNEQSSSSQTARIASSAPCALLKSGVSIIKGPTPVRHLNLTQLFYQDSLGPLAGIIADRALSSTSIAKFAISLNWSLLSPMIDCLLGVAAASHSLLMPLNDDSSVQNTQKSLIDEKWKWSFLPSQLKSKNKSSLTVMSLHDSSSDLIRWLVTAEILPPSALLPLVGHDDTLTVNDFHLPQPEEEFSTPPQSTNRQRVAVASVDLAKDVLANHENLTAPPCGSQLPDDSLLPQHLARQLLSLPPPETRVLSRLNLIRSSSSFASNSSNSDIDD